jgi:allophanate hydrolase subunit 2
MRDGPTVGGYPKIAIVDDASLDWLAQAAPGVMFQFVAV